MFTGIVEELGQIVKLEKDGGNLHISVKADFTPELKIDQSVAHDGVCLTVVDLQDSFYKVTAIEETLRKTTLGELEVGNNVNLERGMKLGARLDGHIVQGHVDQVAKCTRKTDQSGSTVFTFEYDSSSGNVTIEKGSITVNGVSLTVVDSEENRFSVAIIPYTLENTTFSTLTEGTMVNLEFDVVGKYVKRLMAPHS